MKNLQKHLLVLQHHSCENLGSIAGALQLAHVAPRYIRSDAGEAVPAELGEAAGLIVMGGPQSVYEDDRFPYLRDEMRLIEDALRRERPVLGTCLGSQLLASALGAKVYAGERKEIGWFPVVLTDVAMTDPLFVGVPHTFIACHWHGDVFELPRGAAHLASSALTRHQAFCHGKNAYGLLFHLEVSESQIAEMVTLFADELHAAGVDARALLTQTRKNVVAAQRIGASVYQRWTALLE